MVTRKKLFILVFLTLFSTGLAKKSVEIATKLAEFTKQADKLAESEHMLRAACFPSSTECEGINKIIESITRNFNICCAELQAKLNDLIIPKITTIPLPCDLPTPITQADIPITLTTSGSYCLIETVTNDSGAAITIAANDVLVDLNNFAIIGGDNGIVVDGHSNVVISNGSIEETSGAATLLTSCTSVRLSDIYAFFCDTALECDNCNGLLIQRYSLGAPFEEVTSYGLRFLNGTQNVKIECCQLRDAPQIGFEVNNGQSFYFTDCTFSSINLPSDKIGFWVHNGSSSCVFKDCQVFDTRRNGFGFLFDNATNCVCSNCSVTLSPLNRALAGINAFQLQNNCQAIVLTGCQALNNNGNDIFPNSGTGFVLDTVQNCCCLGCTAKNNSFDGFFVDTCTDCYLVDNIAIANGRNGFELTGAGDTIFFGNYAEANTLANWAVSTDFAPTFSLSISTGAITPIAPRTAPVTKWDNIDVVA